VAEIVPAKRVLVTGASGFAGCSVIPELASAGYEVHATARRSCSVRGATRFVVADLLEAPLDPLLEGMDAVVHLAARAHVMHERARDPEAEYMRDNCVLTQQLAMAALRMGVRRFVFSSSIKVMGESTHELPFTESDPARPLDAYGRSKLAAERILEGIARESNLAVVILRPPLMYGPGVRGNLLRLMRLVDKDIPLPVSSIGNYRSLLGVRNFGSAVSAILSAPAQPYRAYLVSDGEAVSTPELVRIIAKALGKRARSFAFPKVILQMAANAIGRRREVDRMTESLVVDDSLFREELGWSPPFSLAEGLAQMAMAYRESLTSAR